MVISFKRAYHKRHKAPLCQRKKSSIRLALAAVSVSLYFSVKCKGQSTTAKQVITIGSDEEEEDASNISRKLVQNMSKAPARNSRPRALEDIENVSVSMYFTVTGW